MHRPLVLSSIILDPSTASQIQPGAKGGPSKTSSDSGSDSSSEDKKTESAITLTTKPSEDVDVGPMIGANSVTTATESVFTIGTEVDASASKLPYTALSAVAQEEEFQGGLDYEDDAFFTMFNDANPFHKSSAEQYSAFLTLWQLLMLVGVRSLSTQWSLLML